MSYTHPDHVDPRQKIRSFALAATINGTAIAALLLAPAAVVEIRERGVIKAIPPSVEVPLPPPPPPEQKQVDDPLPTDTIIDRVVYLPIESSSAELQRYASGELHMTSTVPVSQMARLKKERPKELVMVPSMATYMYAFNVNRPPFDDVRVRRALTYAIDRNIIVSYITRGNQMPAFTLTPPYVSGFDFRQPEYATWSQTRRDEEAREALEEAGYYEDNPLEFELLYNTDESHKALAIVVSQMWKEKLGAKVTISNLEWKTFLSEKQAGNYGIARFGWKGDYNEASTFLTLLTSDSGNNDGGWSNETYDQLLLDARSSDDPNPYYVRAEEILWQAFPVVPVYFNTTVALVSPSLKGYPEKNPRNIVYSKDMYITAD